MTPAPRPYHQRASMNLSLLLESFVRNHGLGQVYAAPIDVVFSDYDTTQPDLIFISHDRKNILAEYNVRGAPDLVVEILSPNTAEMDRRTKLRLYEKYGVREYWLVSPEAENIQILVLRGSKYELLGNFSGTQEVHSEVLDGFTCKASEVFQV